MTNESQVLTDYGRLQIDSDSNPAVPSAKKTKVNVKDFVHGGHSMSTGTAVFDEIGGKPT